MNRLTFTMTFLGFICLVFAPATTAGEELTADDYIEFWRPLAGVWKGVIESGGKSMDTLWRARLARNQKCFVTYATGGDTPALQTIDGYDPGTGKWTFAGFDADGSYRLATIEFADMKKGKHLDKGVIGIFEMKKYSNDGKLTTSSSVMSCTEFAEDRIVLTWSDAKEDGKPVPDRKTVLKRQPERSRRTRR